MTDSTKPQPAPFDPMEIEEYRAFIAQLQRHLVGSMRLRREQPAPKLPSAPDAVVASGNESIPVVASADDLDAAIEYADGHPHARWYVARRARALGEDDRLPGDWQGLLAAIDDRSSSNLVYARRRMRAMRQLSAQQKRATVASARTFTPEQRRTYARQRLAMPDGSFPVPDRDALRRAVQSYGHAPRGKRAAVRRHLVRRARALGALELIPDAWLRRSAASGRQKRAPATRG